ncbi:PadR family transcriptional regulator [Streptomyces sp. NPDC029006]|uniref:PadR family transcriptional regulator n=1 Tax=Streptomyces sp. NPDC029006 TaxID=3155467 RepID=UPI00340E3EE5
MSDNRRFAYGEVRFHLLDELARRPRHGYELLTALSEKFGGAYRPSPGTVYPRLRRLEAEGLVRHELVRGRKVYHLTDAGRQELEQARAGTDSGPRPGASDHDTAEASTTAAGGLSESIRKDVEAIVRDFREQFQAATGRPTDTSDDQNWFTWAGWASPGAQPTGRERLRQRLGEVTAAAQDLLAEESVPDDSLRQAARLLAETADALRALPPQD